ncbi:MAG: pyridoxamine 5'-phosphate oxidase [Proteobacteria bacterium]|nr:MAG: pyridoxamine 5'-phosphate oxidase [Pseudomonadota bacterium]
MARKSMKDVAKLMADLDICMLTTVMARGVTASRPMSNNGDVEYKGDSYFFTWAKSKMAKDIQKNKNVSLSMQGKKMFKPLLISVSGEAELIKDREVMEEHWNKDLEIYFRKGLDTPGIVMIHVRAKHIKYWHGGDEGEVKVGKN